MTSKQKCSVNSQGSEKRSVRKCVGQLGKPTVWKALPDCLGDGRRPKEGPGGTLELSSWLRVDEHNITKETERIYQEKRK